MTRVRITHDHDWFKGKIGYVIERINQHSLYTYVVVFKNHLEPRAYQRFDIKFLKDVKTPKWLKVIPRNQHG